MPLKVDFTHCVGHYLEMRAAICVGFGVGGPVYFWVTGRLGYSDACSQLPELSVLVGCSV